MLEKKCAGRERKWPFCVDVSWVPGFDAACKEEKEKRRRIGGEGCR